MSHQPQLEHQGRVTPNGDAAQVYFPKDYTRQAIFPLVPGHEFVSLLVPERAVVLVPDTADYSFPFEVTVHDPQAYRIRIDHDGDARRHTAAKNPRGGDQP